MNSTVKSRLESIHIGEPQTYKNIAILPLIAPADGTFQYRTLGEALAGREIAITEVSAGGSVPDLMVVTRGEPTYNVGILKIAPIDRTVDILDGSRIEFAKRRVAGRGDEKAGLTKAEIQQVESGYGGKNPPDREYRKVSGRNPLIMIMFARLRTSGPPSPEDPVVASYGLSFPGDSGTARRPDRLVEYVVNTTWWHQNYDSTEDDPEATE